MNSRMSATRHRTAAVLNRFAPGAGLVLRGQPLAGTLLGLTFTASANMVVISTFLVPDDVPPSVRGASYAAGIGAYILAQWQFRRAATAVDPEQAARRRAAIRTARDALRGGAPETAVRALSPLPELIERDLAAAYLYAQALTETGAPDEAQRAWQRVRTLDRSRIYRDEVRAAEQLLRPLAANPPEERPPGPASVDLTHADGR